MSSTRTIDIGDKEYANLSMREWEPSQGPLSDGSEFYQVNDTVYLTTFSGNDPHRFKAFRCLVAHNSNAVFQADENAGYWGHILEHELRYHPNVEIALKSNEDVGLFDAPSDIKDGVTLTVGNSRILLMGQNDASENGLWVYDGNGVSLSRPLDYNALHPGTVGEHVIVNNGTFENSLFALVYSSNTTNKNTVEINTDENKWAQIQSKDLIITPVEVVAIKNENIASFGSIFNGYEGVVLTPGESRILLVEQDNAVENGIWIYNGDNSALTRPDDYNNTNDHYIGQETMVKLGSFAGVQYRIYSTSNADSGTVVVDTDETIWVKEGIDKHIHPCHVALSTNQDISTISAPSETLDGILLSVGNSRILLIGQTDERENGPWVFNGDGNALTRPNDFNDRFLQIVGQEVMINYGTYERNQFRLNWTENADYKSIEVDVNRHQWINEDSAKGVHFKTTNQDDYTPGRHMKFWIGTQVERDAIVTIDPDTIYYIDDDA